VRASVRLTALALVALVALVAPAGCSLLFPFDLPAPPDTGTREDAPALDAGVEWDGDTGSNPLESGTDPDAPVQLDAGPRIFPCKDDAGCVACEPVTNKLCTMSCTLGDCNDGLPQARDPWPNTCNKLLLEDDFVGSSAKWQRIHNGLNIYEKPCGVLEFDVASHTTQWMQLNTAAASQLPDDYLIEVRFFAPATTGSWRFYLAANSQGRQTKPGRVCKLQYDAVTKMITISNLVNGVHHDTAGPYAWSGDGVLQSWYAGDKHFCRLRGYTVFSSDLKGSAPTGETVEIAAVSPMNQPRLFFYLDYVRIFAPGLTRRRGARRLGRQRVPVGRGAPQRLALGDHILTAEAAHGLGHHLDPLLEGEGVVEVEGVDRHRPGPHRDEARDRPALEERPARVEVILAACAVVGGRPGALVAPDQEVPLAPPGPLVGPLQVDQHADVLALDALALQHHVPRHLARSEGRRGGGGGEALIPGGVEATQRRALSGEGIHGQP